MTRSPRLVWQAAVTVGRTFGFAGGLHRAGFEARKRLGWLRESPRSPAAATRPERVRRSIYGPDDAYSRLAPDAASRALSRGDRVAGGEYEAYGGSWRALPSTPDAWRRHPATGYHFGNDAWWTIEHLPSGADIKDVWEPGRFGWVYDLVRADALSGSPRYAEAFATHFDVWLRAAPPFRGPQWACGQETAIRAIALLHAEAALMPRLPDGDLVARMPQVLAWSGERIEDAIGYALSQRNNHGISESAGLIHLGLRLDGTHPSAQRWLRTGIRHLREQIRDQFSHDGWYSQHSFTYLRLALDQALLAQHRLRAAGTSLPDDCLLRLRRGAALLAAVVCARTGVVPNYGANDGGRAVPWSTAPYRDFRPSLTMASIVLDAPLPADIPANDEVSAWLGATPAVGPFRADGIERGASGWAVARTAAVSVFFRAGRLRHRPSHLDQLHLDVRHDGREIVTDPGTYAYNAPPPWRNALVSAFVHNGPILNQTEPGVRGPRFLWYAWPEAELTESAADGGDLVLAGRTSGSARIPGVERRVRISGSAVTVEDRVLADSCRMLQVTWLLHPDVPEDVTIDAELMPRSSSASLTVEKIAGVDGAIDGWFSPTYGVRQSTHAVRLGASGVSAGSSLITRFELGGTT